jgi:hypothetical protein
LEIEIAELWSMRISPATLYNIERTTDDNPVGGGGAVYIQIAKGLVADFLKFIRSEYPENGEVIELQVGNFMSPTSPQKTLTFSSKSQGRMRIANQNRHRAERLSAWSSDEGFPSLKAGQNTEDARALLEEIGGLRIFLVRGEDGNIWAGYTIGEANDAEAKQPFASINWGTETSGGYWQYEETK